MIQSHSRFMDSSLVVEHNAVKSILFRLAELLLGFAVFKYFSFAASKLDAFTSYLLFKEDAIQRGLFIFSNKFSRAGVLVFVFGIVIVIADLYGTLLWALDAPGWHVTRYNTSARAIAGNLLDDAGYVVQIRAQPGDIRDLSAKIPEIIGANLVKAGINFTLLGENERSQPTIAKPALPFSEAYARIWLDDDGWSISPDQYFTVASAGGDTGLTLPLDCPWQEITPGLDAYWNCTFDNTYAVSLARDKTLGVPLIHWDRENDDDMDTRYIQPSRADNPWASLGTGGSTASLKQMFTVTKGKIKHTFIHDVFKATLISADTYKKVDQDEVTDLVKRTFSLDPVEQQDPIIPMVVHSIMNAQAKNKSFTAGISSNGRDGHSVAQVAWELLCPSVAGQCLYSMVRVSVMNITLWRTDILPEPVKPFRPADQCGGSFSNIAYGGKTTDTDCYVSRGSVPNPHFFGEVDTSATLIISGLMGYGRANHSTEALNQTGHEWLLRNDGRLSDLVLSRGMIVGLSPDLVTIELSHIKPALSYLQLTLVFVSLILAIIGWVLMYRNKYYTSSLLAILLTTAHTDKKDETPGYMTAVPDIHLGKKESKVMMGVADGAFVVDASHQLQPSKRGSQRGGYYRAPANEEGSELKWGNVKVAEGQVTPGSVMTPAPQFPPYTTYQAGAQQGHFNQQPVSPLPSASPYPVQPTWSPSQGQQVVLPPHQTWPPPPPSGQHM